MNANYQEEENIIPAAVVLAAGLSRRMGRPKMILPWGKTTVIGEVVATLRAAGVGDIVVVTGGARELVEAEVTALGVRPVFNSDYANGEMLLSVQAGIQALPGYVDSVLTVLGDQPQMEEWVVREVLKIYAMERPNLIVPSYQMRRGHPWLIRKPLWSSLLALKSPATMRDFLEMHQKDIKYFEVDTSSVLKDLDTPEDYMRSNIDR